MLKIILYLFYIILYLDGLVIETIIMKSIP